MKNIRLEIEPGCKAKAVVDPFYAKNGSRGVARPEDVFFIALNEAKTVGCVRYCVEEDVSLLRTMMIDETFRGQGVGPKETPQFLLDRLTEYKKTGKTYLCMRRP